MAEATAAEALAKFYEPRYSVIDLQKAYADGHAAALAEIDVDWLLAILQADSADAHRDPMWRYGVTHALTLARNALTPDTKENN